MELPQTKLKKPNHTSRLNTSLWMFLLVEDDPPGHLNWRNSSIHPIGPRFVSGRLLLPVSGRSRGAEKVVARVLPEATLLLADLEPTPTVGGNSG